MVPDPRLQQHADGHGLGTPAGGAGAGGAGGGAGAGAGGAAGGGAGGGASRESGGLLPSSGAAARVHTRVRMRQTSLTPMRGPTLNSQGS